MRQVVDDDDADEHRWKLKDGLVGLELFVGNGRIAAAKIAAAREDVLCAFAGALRQIANYDKRNLLVIFIGPADVERFGQGRTGGDQRMAFLTDRAWNVEDKFGCAHGERE